MMKQISPSTGRLRSIDRKTELYHQLFDFIAILSGFLDICIVLDHRALQLTKIKLIHAKI